MTPKRKLWTADARIFARAQRGAAQACFPHRDLDPVVREVCRDHFDRHHVEATWQFSRQRSLAFIRPPTAHIYIHNALNAADVPENVFRMIMVHELLHLEVPVGIGADGLPEPHPQEFWEAERSRNPYLEEGWSWLQQSLPLRQRPRFKCTEVVPRVIRLTPQQRLWVQEQRGKLPPKVIRLDDPGVRAMDPALWATMILAHHIRDLEATQEND